MKNISLAVLMVLGIAGMKAQGKTNRVFYIADAKIACQVNNNISSCYKVKIHADSNWREFPYPIEGFIYEAGIETKVEVEETPKLFPDSTGLKYTYKLIRVLESRNTILEDKRLLNGNKWKIINLEFETKPIPARKAGAYICFNTDSNSISGFGGCNHFKTNTHFENGVMQFGIVNITPNTCVHDELEKRIMDGLKGKAAFYIRNNMLFIVCEDHLMIHLRPEKRLDSMIKLINGPIQFKNENIFTALPNGDYSVVLDSFSASVNKQFLFNSRKLNTTEQKTLHLKLLNINPDDPLMEIHILKKPHKKMDYYYATVVFRNGTRKSMVIRNVL